MLDVVTPKKMSKEFCPYDVKAQLSTDKRISAYTANNYQTEL